MKTNFCPIFYRTPWAAIAQGVAGTAQAVAGFFQQRNALKSIDKLQSPTYDPNQSIMDYYNKALSRYSVNPQDSALYKSQTKNATRGLAFGARFLKDRRQAGAASGLVSGYNDAMLKAEVAAEDERARRFSQLGGATGMKAGEERLAFDINKIQPFERKYNLLAMRAGGGSQIMNAGLSNVFGSTQSLSERDMINQYYKQQNKQPNGG